MVLIQCLQLHDFIVVSDSEWIHPVDLRDVVRDEHAVSASTAQTRANDPGGLPASLLADAPWLSRMMGSRLDRRGPDPFAVRDGGGGGGTDGGAVDIDVATLAADIDVHWDTLKELRERHAARTDRPGVKYFDYRILGGKTSTEKTGTN